jgi:hypothetical protein
VTRLVIILLMFGVLLPGAISLLSGYPAARRAAERQFLLSRPGEPDSVDFIAHGVRYGMTIDEVDRLMQDAYERSPLYRTIEPPTGELSRKYHFRYGPTWRLPFEDKGRYVIKETIEVYFDSECRAFRLERSVQTHGKLVHAFDADVDLSPDRSRSADQGKKVRDERRDGERMVPGNSRSKPERGGVSDQRRAGTERARGGV